MPTEPATSRYAIYYLPDPASAIWRFGSSVLGYDAYAASDVAPPADLARTEPRLAEQTAEPRRYGFHATLWAPTPLAAGTDERELVAAVRGFASLRQPFVVPALRVAVLEDFIALVPGVACPDLDTLAADCVRSFAAYRPPLGEADRRRRLAAGLTRRQADYLATWGYPFVLDEFRFHMTLTGALPAEDRERLAARLAAAYASISAPLLVDAVTVLCQPTRAERFRVVERIGFARSQPA
jgi:putative phosphonate metabolism protein